jgi:hypothetical protein
VWCAAAAAHQLKAASTLMPLCACVTQNRNDCLLVLRKDAFRKDVFRPNVRLAASLHFAREAWAMAARDSNSDAIVARTQEAGRHAKA